MTRNPGLGASRHEEQADRDRQTSSLAAMAVVLAVVVASLFLVRILGTEGRVEDCLLAGSRNCDLIAPLPRAVQAW